MKLTHAQVRLINPRHIKKMNEKIVSRFGNGNKITSGSIEFTDSGKIRYNIVLNNYNVYKPVAMLERIGKEVKKIWKADEVYYFGQQIA